MPPRHQQGRDRSDGVSKEWRPEETPRPRGEPLQVGGRFSSLNGTFVLPDGGRLDLGVVRDATLVGTNDFFLTTSLPVAIHPSRQGFLIVAVGAGLLFALGAPDFS